MARNSIGTLAVQVQADTTQFVNGMAQAAGRIDNFTQRVQKSRTAVTGLGAALRMPGLTRGGAFGGAASGAAGALGLGLLGGGVAGIAATGAFLVVDGLIQRERKLAEAIKATREALKAAAQASRDRFAAFTELTDKMRIGLGPDADSKQGRIDAIYRESREQVQAIRDRIAAIDAELNSRKDLLGIERSELRGQRDRAIGLGSEIVADAERRVRGIREESSPSGFASLLRSAQADPVARWNRIVDSLRSSGEATRALIASNEAKAEQERQNQLQNKALFEAWRIENQRAFDPIVASIGRIQGQVGQLLFKRDR